MTERIYLDWNATAPLRPAARAAMLAALDQVGNPSSVHAEGRAARHLVETARERVAALVGAEARNVIFTSGGTEANGLALGPAIERPGHKEPLERLMVSASSALASATPPRSSVRKPSTSCSGQSVRLAMVRFLTLPSAR